MDRKKASKSSQSIRSDERGIGPKSSLYLLHGAGQQGGRTRSGRVFNALNHDSTGSRAIMPASSAFASSCLVPDHAPSSSPFQENAHEVLPCLARLGLLAIEITRSLRSVSKGLRALLIDSVRKIEVSADWNSRLDLDCAVAAFPLCQSIEITGSMDFKVSMAPVAGLKALTSLDLTDAPRIYSSDLALIANLARLTELKLNRPEDNPLRRLCGIKASDLAQLSFLKYLQHLQLGVFGDTTKEHILAVCSITSLRSLEIYDRYFSWHQSGGYRMGGAEIEALSKLTHLETLWCPLPDDSYAEEEAAWENTISSLLKCSLRSIRVHSNNLPFSFVNAVSHALLSGRALDLLAFYVECGVGERLDELEGREFEPSGLARVKTLELHSYKGLSFSSINWLLACPNLKPFQVLSEEMGDPYEVVQMADGPGIRGGWMSRISADVSWHHHNRR